MTTQTELHFSNGSVTTTVTMEILVETSTGKILAPNTVLLLDSFNGTTVQHSSSNSSNDDLKILSTPTEPNRVSTSAEHSTTVFATINGSILNGSNLTTSESVSTAARQRESISTTLLGSNVLETNATTKPTSVASIEANATLTTTLFISPEASVTINTANLLTSKTFVSRETIIVKENNISTPPINQYTSIGNESALPAISDGNLLSTNSIVNTSKIFTAVPEFSVSLNNALSLSTEHVTSLLNYSNPTTSVSNNSSLHSLTNYTLNTLSIDHVITTTVPTLEIPTASMSVINAKTTDFLLPNTVSQENQTKKISDTELHTFVTSSMLSIVLLNTSQKTTNNSVMSQTPLIEVSTEPLIKDKNNTFLQHSSSNEITTLPSIFTISLSSANSSQEHMMSSTLADNIPSVTRLHETKMPASNDTYTPSSDKMLSHTAPNTQLTMLQTTLQPQQPTSISNNFSSEFTGLDSSLNHTTQASLISTHLITAGAGSANNNGTQQNINMPLTTVAQHETQSHSTATEATNSHSSIQPNSTLPVTTPTDRLTSITTQSNPILLISTFHSDNQSIPMITTTDNQSIPMITTTDNQSIPMITTTYNQSIPMITTAALYTNQSNSMTGSVTTAYQNSTQSNTATNLADSNSKNASTLSTAATTTFSSTILTNTDSTAASLPIVHVSTSNTTTYPPVSPTSNTTIQLHQPSSTILYTVTSNSNTSPPTTIATVTAAQSTSQQSNVVIVTSSVQPKTQASTSKLLATSIPLTRLNSNMAYTTATIRARNSSQTLNNTALAGEKYTLIIM